MSQLQRQRLEDGVKLKIMLQRCESGQESLNWALIKMDLAELQDAPNN